jgi:hypothetical protein
MNSPERVFIGSVVGFFVVLLLGIEFQLLCIVKLLEKLVDR